MTSYKVEGWIRIRRRDCDIWMIFGMKNVCISRMIGTVLWTFIFIFILFIFHCFSGLARWMATRFLPRYLR